MHSFWRRVRYLLLCLLALCLLCIPLALAWAAYQAIDDQALLTAAPNVSPARVASAQRLIARNDPRKQPAGVLRSVQLGEDELNLALVYLASRYPHTRTQISLQEGAVQVRSSSFLPPNPFGNYLNVQAVLRETAGLPEVEQLLLGRLVVPPRLANPLLRWGLARLQTHQNMEGAAAALDSIQHVGMRNGVLRVVFTWDDTLPAQLLNACGQAMLAGYLGLLLSYHLDTPSGPTIIGCAGALYFASLLLAPGGWLPRALNRTHRVA